MTAQSARLSGDRLHLSHGPIDLIIGADGQRARAFAAAEARFATVLQELMCELPLLRRPVGVRPDQVIARRMHAAALPHRDGLTTPMIAVAGAVAEEVLAAMTAAADLSRAYVNNGGDIALHLSDQARFRVAIASPEGRGLGHIDIAASDPVRGIATSGQKGRSLSLGIADTVTVLAACASMADAAATRIGNAVDLPGHPGISRTPACGLHDDSDLGMAPVVHHVGALSEGDISHALARGTRAAQTMQSDGLITAAALFLRGQSAMVGLPDTTSRDLKEPDPCMIS